MILSVLVTPISGVYEVSMKFPVIYIDIELFKNSADSAEKLTWLCDAQFNSLSFEPKMKFLCLIVMNWSHLKRVPTHQQKIWSNHVMNGSICPNVDRFLDKINLCDLGLTSRGHVRSNLTLPFERPGMTSYPCFIGIFALMWTVFKIKAHLNPWDLDLTWHGHVRSNQTLPFERPGMTSYPCLIAIFALCRPLTSTKSRTASWKDFISMFYRNICPNVDHFQDNSPLKSTWPRFDIMRSCEVKSYIAIWKAWYDFLSMFYSNIYPNVDRFQDKRPFKYRI